MRTKSRSEFLALMACSFGLMIQGCATSYQRTGFTGGFSETQLAPDVFRVSFSGNGYTSTDRAADFALLRGAELCAQNGFPFMTLLDSKSDTRAETYVTPQQAHTYGTVNTYGNSASYSGTTTYTGGQVMTFYKPGVGLMVQGLKEKPNGSFAFDTQFLIETLKAKYKIDK